jgi:hypothetical protein
MEQQPSIQEQIAGKHARVRELLEDKDAPESIGRLVLVYEREISELEAQKPN